MSSPVDLRVSRSVELLRQLRHTLADLARKEDQLARDLSTRRLALNRRFRETNAKAEAALTARIEQEDAFFREEQERIRGIHERRRSRIQKAHRAGARAVLTKARNEKDRWVGELQMRHLRAERALPADLKAADAAHAQFEATLAEQSAGLARLERRARKFFAGYPSFRKTLRREWAAAPASLDGSRTPEELLHELQTDLAAGEQELAEFRRFLLPRFFTYVPPLLIILALVLGTAAAGLVLRLEPTVLIAAAVAVAVLSAAVVFVYQLGMRRARPAALTIIGRLVQARVKHDACSTASRMKHESERKRIQEEYDRTYAEIDKQWHRADEVERRFERTARQKIETQAPRALATNDRLLEPRLQQLETSHQSRRESLTRELETQTRLHAEAHHADVAVLDAEENARWCELTAEWEREALPIFETIRTWNAVADTCFPPWSERLVHAWVAPDEFMPATKFGRIHVDLASKPGAIPKDPRLALPGGSTEIALPLALAFPAQGSLVFETSDSGDYTVIGSLNNVILRLLSTTPPGKLSFTIIDPVGLGQNFAGLMHLGDYEESLINRRIWTQRDQIEERLAELNEHIEKVIQMYLRNEFATITEYNEQAGSVAEKYHFLVIADFPANFSETAAKRLQSIALSGPRCGVFTLLHWDRRQPLPDGVLADDLRVNSVNIRREKNEFIVDPEQTKAGAALVFEMPPEPDLAAILIHRIGKSSVDSNRVEVPFAQIAPRPAEMWMNDTTTELRIPIGRTGATKLQYLAIGKGTRQHALFAGKTGSGKSTLFHVIITNLALACSPEQVEFYLIDFKKGVEFKCYATKRLPHARVVAIESDREFALSVLQRVDEELKRRGDMFRKLGVQDIAGFKRAGGTEPIPRSLLIIDEFQEFFVEDDSVAQTASLLFDRIVRQGRAFGIHVLLGSQTLGGAYTLARATLGQMVIRVALQCNEADAYLIMDENNAAPRLLSRPGEGIYNDAAGALEGNSPFQVVWLPDQERDSWLDQVHELATQHRSSERTPIVFEGNAPAEISENNALRHALDTLPVAPPPVGRCWLGAPNAIKGPTEAVFQRQSGNHLLIVGQRDEASLTLLGVSLLALGAQYPIGAAKFVLLHSAAANSPDEQFIDQIVAAIPHQVAIARGNDVAEKMEDIAADLKRRIAGDEAPEDLPEVFLFIYGLHRFKKLRHEDDFSFSMSEGDAGSSNPGAQLNELISEGSSHGMHILASLDTFNNVNRFLSRKALSEFEMRVVFQMGASDSASLIDSPKASTLGLHRAILYNEHAGTLETFRPYATPDSSWIAEAAAKLARLRG